MRVSSPEKKLDRSIDEAEDFRYSMALLDLPSTAQTPGNNGEGNGAVEMQTTNTNFK